MTNGKYKISIALCTYNGAKFIIRQLESFSAQTRLPDELVICDDCSSDATVEIIRDFISNAPFPVWLQVNQTNLGSTKNFEKAISSCAGELIYLSDQDDLWLPDKIARIEAEFEKNPKVGMVFSDAEIVDENLQPLGRTLWSFTFSDEKREVARAGKFFDVLLAQNVVTGATMAFRAEFRKTFTPIPEGIPNLIHDGWISLVIAGEAEVVFIDEPLVKYRQHAAQQLGIGYEATLAVDFNERRNRYGASIAFSENEVARLKQMEEIFAVYPQFARKRGGTIEFANLIEEKRAKIAHYEARRRLPLTRFGRLLPVLREVSSGRYRRFSKGWLSAAKDLLEKW